MVKKNNSLSLYSPIDDIFNAVEKHFDTVGYHSFTPSLLTHVFKDIAFPDFECSLSHPVSNCYMEPNGTWVIEIAVTGFQKEDIKINRENNFITIKGIGSKKQSERKYLFQKLAKRDFEVSYELSNKLDLEKIEVKLADGLLELRIPAKESEKPVRQEIQIK